MNNFENKSITYIGDLNSSTLIFSNMNSNKIFILGVKILTIILTALLNGILIYIFGFLIKKKTFSNLIFLSIAISDFIIGSLSMSSQVILDNLEEWPFDKFSCLISVYFQYAIPDTTIFALLILAIHRYIQLKSPFNVSERINKLNLIKLFSAWVIPTTFWIGSICFFILNDQFSIKKCNIEPSIKFKTIKVTLFGLLPLFSIIVLNILLMKGLNKKGKRFSTKRKIKKKEMDKEDTNSLIEHQPVKTYTLANNMVDTECDKHDYQNHNQITISFNVVHSKRLKPHKRSINKDRRAFICIFALTLSIFFTQIIYLIMWPMPRIRNLEFSVNIIYQIGVWLSYLTSLTNPILLCFFHEKVKQEINKFLPKCS